MGIHHVFIIFPPTLNHSGHCSFIIIYQDIVPHGKVHCTLSHSYYLSSLSLIVLGLEAQEFRYHVDECFKSLLDS